MKLPEWRLEEYVGYLVEAEKRRRDIWGNMVPDPISVAIDGDAVYEMTQLLSPKLFVKPPMLKDNKLWIFWSNTCQHLDTTTTTLIPTPPPSSSSASACLVPPKLTKLKEKIKNALQHYACPVRRQGILVQFWAPTKTDGGRCILTTVDQPFAIDIPHRGLCSYRNFSVGWRFAVDEVTESNLVEDQLLFGLPGRVFRNKCPESTPDVSYYSIKEYPQRDFALSCGIQGSFAWPVFEPTGDHCCAGVLEIVVTDECVGYSKFHRLLTEVASPESPFGFTFRKIQVTFESAADEILEVLTEVCETHQLALAQTWVPLKYTTTAMTNGSILDLKYNAYRSSCPEDFMVAINSEVDTFCMQGEKFSTICSKYLLRKGAGLVGRTLVSHKPCYCRDVTQLSMTDYPLAHYARNCGFTGCFTICLRSTFTGDVDYVLEFFLHPADSEDPWSFLDTLLATMKQHLRSFKVASGEEFGEALVVEVYKSSLKEEPNSFNFCQTTRSMPRLEGSENEGEVAVLDPPHQKLMEEGEQHEKNICGDGIVNTTIPSEQGPINKSSKRAHVDTESGISYEDLEKHFGRPLVDAAESLNISRSTFKRLCRKHGIFRWPNCKSKKLKGLPTFSNISCNKICGTGEEQIPICNREEPSSSEIPSMTGEADVSAHTIRQVSSGPNVNNITVKATYNGVLIKFRLSPFSRLAELEEKVRTRLKLKDGSFSIKYEDNESEWVLIACDEDLQDCMESSKSLNSTNIRMMVDLPITTQAP